METLQEITVFYTNNNAELNSFNDVVKSSLSLDYLQQLYQNELNIIVDEIVFN